MDKIVFYPMHAKAVTSSIRKEVNPVHSNNKKFSVHLQTAIQADSKLLVSKHAKERLQQRSIHINESLWELIAEKVQQAKKKGVNESLVLLKDAALIVSAKNNTVITAMDRDEARTQIFTNINGTIILDQ